MRIVLTGGGSAGHIIPLGPLIEMLRQHHMARRAMLPHWLRPDSLELYFVGARAGGTEDFMAGYDVPVKGVPAGKLRRYASLLTLFDLLWWFPLGIVLALWHLFWLMPEVVVSKGGYGSVPVTVAAWFYRIPILLHESDAVPGLANRWGSRLATAVAVGFESAREHWPARYKKKLFVTGIPVRRDLEQFSVAEAKAFFTLPANEKVLLVMGGSQGAQAINESILKILPQLISDMTVLHVTGERHFKAVQTVTTELLAQSSRRTAYKVFPYLKDELGRALVVADTVVSRAGATMLAELARLKKVALLIPLPAPPAASDHQMRNAELFERYGAARVLESGNVTPALLLQNIRDLMGDMAMRQQLQDGMAAMDRAGAAAALAQLSFCLAMRVPPTLAA